MVLGCVIYTIVDNYVCIDYLAWQSKKLSDICINRKYLEKSFNKFLGIGISYLLMKLLLCRGFMRNINSTVILICPSGILKYYFPKRFVILERNSNKLSRIKNNTKQIIHATDIHYSDYVMICTT